MRPHNYVILKSDLDHWRHRSETAAAFAVQTSKQVTPYGAKWRKNKRNYTCVDLGSDARILAPLDPNWSWILSSFRSIWPLYLPMNWSPQADARYRGSTTKMTILVSSFWVYWSNSVQLREKWQYPNNVLRLTSSRVPVSASCIVVLFLDR